MTTRLLSSIIVEKTVFNMRDCSIVERYCELNPDACCAIQTCLPKPLQKTLYYCPRTIFCDAYASPFFGGRTQNAFLPFYACVENVFGAGSVSQFIPYQMVYRPDLSSPNSYPKLWIWKGDFKVGNYSGAPGTWIFPYFSTTGEFRVTQITSGAACIASTFLQWSYKGTAPPDTSTFWGFNGDFSSEWFPTSSTSASSNPLGAGLGPVDGYNQYNPYSNYLEFAVQPTVAQGDEFTADANLPKTIGIPPHAIITSEPNGSELPPTRTYRCPEILLPPRLHATVTGCPDTEFNAVHVLEWKWGKFYKEFTATRGGVPLRFGIEVYPHIARRKNWVCALRIARNDFTLASEPSFSHGRYFGWVRMERCFPLWAVSILGQFQTANIATHMTVEEF